MTVGIIVLVVLGVMTFAQVVLLAGAQRKRHQELFVHLDRLERGQVEASAARVSR